MPRNQPKIENDAEATAAGNGSAQVEPATLTPEEERAKIQDTYRRVYELEEIIAEREDEHLRPLKDGRREAWLSLKGATGIALRRLKHGYADYKDARAAINSDDEADKIRILDDMRRVRAATGGGDQLNFLTGLLGPDLATTAGMRVDESAHALHDPGDVDDVPFGDEAEPDASVGGFETADDRPRHLRDRHQQSAEREAGRADEQLEEAAQ